MNNIDAIKGMLGYSSKEEQDSAYSSWFTVVAILADAYADAEMLKEETICRWIILEGKIPEFILASGRCIWWTVDFRGASIHSILPFGYYDLVDLNLHVEGDLISCLNRLLAIPDQYLDRFQ